MIKRTLREESKLIDFLWESNAIENVTDDDSFAQALKAWQHLNKFKRLSIKVLNETHAILMKNQPMEEKWKGHFRQRAVWIGGREGKLWYVVPELMRQWIVNANDLVLNHIKKDSPETLERIIKEQHVVAEIVHPYQDGNGRIFRLTLNYQRIHCGLPILVIKDSEKNLYYEWFK